MSARTLILICQPFPFLGGVLPFLILELRLGCIFEHTSSSDPADFLHQLIWRVGQEVDHLMYVMHPSLQTTPRVLGFIPGAVNTPQWRNSRVEGLDVCKFRRRAGCPVCDLSVCIWNINSRREKKRLEQNLFHHYCSIQQQYSEFSTFPNTCR